MKKYNKLVRDKIPEIIKNNGDSFKSHIAEDEEYWQKLKEKLVEEVKEFNEEENIEEMADIYEVLEAISKFKNFQKKKLLKIKENKLKERGGFQDKIILDEA